MSNTFTGTVFPVGSTKQFACQLTVGPQGIAAAQDDGTISVVPFTNLQIRRGGMDGVTLVLTAADGAPTVSSQDPAFATAVANHAGGQIKAELASNQRVQRWRLRRSCGCMALALSAVIVIAVGTLWGLAWAARASTEYIPISVDQKLGEQAIGSMNLGGPVVSYPEVDAFVGETVKRLNAHLLPPGAKAADYAYTLNVRVVDKDEINAFALPGGYIVVYTGLIRQAGSADQVAAILGHEIAHVTRRHGVKGIVRSLGVMAAAQIVLGDVSGVVGLISEGAMTAIINGYSRDQEREADAEGARIAAAAGFDPASLGEFFTLLKTKSDAQSTGILAIMSTHPDHDERIASVKRYAAALPRGARSDLSLQFRAAQAVLELRHSSITIAPPTAPSATSARPASQSAPATAAVGVVGR